MQVALEQVAGAATEERPVAGVVLLAGRGEQRAGPAFGDLAALAAGDGRPAHLLRGGGQVVGVEHRHRTVGLRAVAVSSNRSDLVEVANAGPGCWAKMRASTRKVLPAPEGATRRAEASHDGHSCTPPWTARPSG